MPILNKGTLLENIVLLESARVLLDLKWAGLPFEFVNSFAMPPLSKWKAKKNEECYSKGSLEDLGAADAPSPETYQSLLWHCLRQQNVEVGPNGALLVAMLVAQRDEPLRLWLNDTPDIKGKFYGDALPELGKIDKIVSDVLGKSVTPKFTIATCSERYPSSLFHVNNNLQKVQYEWPANAGVRLGFLDPSQYRLDTKVGPYTHSDNHRDWLDILNDGHAKMVASVHYTWSRKAEVEAKVASMLADGHAEGFTHAVIASHETHLVVVLVHSQQELPTAETVSKIIERSVQRQWDDWYRLVHCAGGKLSLKVVSTASK